MKKILSRLYGKIRKIHSKIKKRDGFICIKIRKMILWDQYIESSMIYTLPIHSLRPKNNILYNKIEGGNFYESSLHNTRNIVDRAQKGAKKLTITIAGKIGGFLGKNPNKETENPIVLSESNNVIRKNTIISIGDLNGNYGALLGNLSKTGIIDDSLNWKGGDTKVVLHGDIFADRHGHSMTIANYLNGLQHEAKLADGDITVLAGNHEDMAFSYLTGEPIHYRGNWSIIQIDSSNEARAGLIELESHITPGITIEQIRENRGTLLKKMRLDREGRESLEFMCKMKLVDRTDDTLRIHVVPHTEMLELIMKMSVDGINILYQRGMRYYLLNEGTLSPTEQVAFKNLRRVFLDTDHRKIEENDIYKKLKEDGINLVISGHDTQQSGEINNIHGVICTGVDFGYGALQLGDRLPGVEKRNTKGRKKSKKILFKTDRRDSSRYTNTLILDKNGSMKFGNGDIYRI